MNEEEEELPDLDEISDPVDLSELFTDPEKSRCDNLVTEPLGYGCFYEKEIQDVKTDNVEIIEAINRFVARNQHCFNCSFCYTKRYFSTYEKKTFNIILYAN